MRRLVSKLKGIDLRMEEAPSLPLGFMEVATAQEIAVDIIAIHGLHGHREGTWTAKKTGVMWLRDLLPAKIPNARILTYGYDAATQSSSPISVLSLFDQATSFAEQLSQIRSANDRRPIIFIAHCLGGIIVKHALVYCNMAGPQHLPHLRNIALSTYGILFFGTPHLGANGIDAASWLINISSIFMHTSDKMVKHLRLDSEHLQQLGVQFVPISHDFNTVFFCETIPTKLMNSRKILVVPHSSAAIPGAVNMQDVQLHRNHIDMVRYDSSEDNEFNRVVSYLSNMVKNAPSAVFNKWKDQNIQNPTHSRSKILIPVKLPFSKNPRFKGRSDELAKIKDIFTQDCDNMKIIVLHGLGGVGKTELVMEVAMQHKADFTALFWLNATNLETLQASFASAAQQLLDTEYKSVSGHQPLSETIRDLGLQGLVDDTGILIPEKLATTKGEIVEAIRNWLSKEDNTQWLLIIDNLDDVESFEKDSYLPMCTNGTILITSRRYESKHLGNFAIEIGDMDPISACQLLVARAGKTYSSLRETDKQEVEQIVKFLGYLPLAIELAGAYIDIQMISFQEYLPRYKSRFQDLMGDLPLGPQRYKEPVYTTWEMSYNMIENINKDAATLLATLGFLSNEILEELIIRSNILSESVLEKAIAKLVSYSLIKLKNEPRRIWIHPVVHEWLQERKTIAEKQKYTKEAIKIISHAIHSDTVRTADDWRFEVMILSDLHACVRNNQKYLSSLEDCDIELAWEIGKIGKIFEFQGLYNHAADLLSQSSKVLTSKLKPNNVNLLENKQDLAQVYVCQRRFPEAETIFREISAAVGEVNDSSDDSLGIRAQCGLAGVLQYQHRYTEAEELYQTVITGLKAANVEADHPFFLATMSNLAQLYGGQGKLEQAKELFYDVLKKKEEVLGVDHPSTIASLNGLAAIYYNQGNFDEAAKHYAKGADIEKTVVGLEHPDYLKSMNNLAWIYVCQKKYQDAEDIYKEIFPLSEKVHGPEDPETLMTRHNLAMVYEYQDKYNAAVNLYKMILGRLSEEETRKPQNLNNIEIMHNLARNYLFTERYEEAEQLLELVKTRRVELLGHDNSSTLESMQKLAETYNQLGKQEEARNLYEDILAIDRLAHKLPRLTYYMVVNRLALIYTAEASYLMAHKLFQEIVSAEDLDLDGKAIITVKVNLGVTLEALGRLSEARELFEETYEMAKDVLGPEHELTKEVLFYCPELLWQ